MGPQTDSSSDGTAYGRREFLVVKIPVVENVDDRWHQREERIDEALRARGLGSVLGWGDSLGEPTSRGRRRVAFTRVDIDISDIAAGRTLLQSALAAIGVPPGTEIHYSIGRVRYADIYAPPEWLLERPQD
ncbi:hypothetical protein [Variovorax saccharolyticus]|uniref:hypothetical protein n=1 Tax=Variovorax saccharolyticus TaxID=3053516 RepID=UPI0025750F0C|nr:hypothetical protein [Variovorax sp. J31P216]MDM0027830.1 hypothetical protein [Variovorax sp. J31P216]